MVRSIFVGLLLLVFVQSGSAQQLHSLLLQQDHPRILLLVEVPAPAAFLREARRFIPKISERLAQALKPWVPPVFQNTWNAPWDFEQPMCLAILQSANGKEASFAFVADAVDSLAVLKSLGVAIRSGGGVTRYEAADGPLFVIQRDSEIFVSQDPGLAAVLLHSKASVRAFSGIPGKIRFMLPISKVAKLAWLEFSRELRKADPKRQDELADLRQVVEGMSQMESLWVGVELQKNALLFHLSIQVFPETAVSRFLVAQGPGASDLLAGLPTDAMAAVGLHLQTTPEWIEALATWADLSMRSYFSTSVGSVSLPDRAIWRKAFQDLLGETGPRYSSALVPVSVGSPQFRWLHFLDHKHPSRFGRSLISFVEASLVNDLLLQQHGLGFILKLHQPQDPRLPSDSRTMEVRVSGILEGTTTKRLFSFPVPGVDTFLPQGTRVLWADGFRSWELALEGREWGQRETWQGLDDERVPGLAFEGRSRHIAGFLRLEPVFAALDRLDNQPVSESVKTFLNLLGSPEDRLLLSGRIEGNTFVLQLRVSLEAIVKSLEIQRHTF